ncbi:FimB/Mfa2 family fimbrial subunit [Prevotella cerevisiae]|uniref:FimB/Mfa2 family fimbrial subunit n=1 Tax=Segatella cerevisiae TaxID=2053716 RepID=A0ABT1BZJ9_9BACT|nr:FimB/Mfa2 family fimbrial subunit [Segatella cerevisiae]MCO6026513.1 FimB/Mfa2 family fimbrial subunit [Segatella cerevisiae]
MCYGVKTIIGAFLLSTFMVSCSIYDKYPCYDQAEITLKLVDSTGAVLPDSIAYKYNINGFVKGAFRYTVPADKDGKYRVVFNSDDRDSISFVAVATSDTSAYRVNIPQTGTVIGDTWLTLDNAEKEGNTPQPVAVYYGSLGIFPEDGKSKSYVIQLKNVLVRVRVQIKGLNDHFSDKDYRIALEGLRSGIAYDGSVSGELVNNDLQGGFESDGNYMILPITVFPTKAGERVRLRIYKSDGSLLLDRDVDEKGRPLELKRNDDVVFVVQVSYPTNITISVIPWAEIDNPIIFQ